MGLTNGYINVYDDWRTPGTIKFGLSVHESAYEAREAAWGSIPQLLHVVRIQWQEGQPHIDIVWSAE